MLGRQRSGLMIKRHIQRHNGHIREPSQGRRERFRPHWVIPGPTDRPCDFGQYQVRHDDGQRPRAEHLKEVPTGRVAGFPLVKPVDPYAGIHRIHGVTDASPALRR
jgi:hypothetical protein